MWVSYSTEVYTATPNLGLAFEFSNIAFLLNGPKEHQQRLLKTVEHPILPKYIAVHGLFNIINIITDQPQTILHPWTPNTALVLSVSATKNPSNTTQRVTETSAASHSKDQCRCRYSWRHPDHKCTRRNVAGMKGYKDKAEECET